MQSTTAFACCKWAGTVGNACQNAAVIEVVPANEASWEDLETVLGPMRCHGDRCYCQRFKSPNAEWGVVSDEERAHRLREQTDCGYPESGTTSGLVAYADGEPAGWCALDPRTAVDFARRQGARAVAGYPLTTTGRVVTWGEMHVGSRNAFVKAGFREVSRPTKRRAVMRIDLTPQPD